jgi:hypothetical protein
LPSGEAMIRITVSPEHPVTVVDADQRHFYFAQIVGASTDMMLLRLRKAVPSLTLLNASSVIIETFAQFSDVRLGQVTIEIGCVNISSPRDSFLKLKLQDAPSLDIRVIPEETTND